MSSLVRLPSLSFGRGILTNAVISDDRVEVSWGGWYSNPHKSLGHLLICLLRILLGWASFSSEKSVRRGTLNHYNARNAAWAGAVVQARWHRKTRFQFPSSLCSVHHIYIPLGDLSRPSTTPTSQGEDNPGGFAGGAECGGLGEQGSGSCCEGNDKHILLQCDLADATSELRSRFHSFKSIQVL